MSKILSVKCHKLTRTLVTKKLVDSDNQRIYDEIIDEIEEKIQRGSSFEIDKSISGISFRILYEPEGQYLFIYKFDRSVGHGSVRVYIKDDDEFNRYDEIIHVLLREIGQQLSHKSLL